jgi:hypothetical protein
MADLAPIRLQPHDASARHRLAHPPRKILGPEFGSELIWIAIC